MKIVVTGAAGYIGSVVTELLVQGGHDVIALDNLVHGHREAVHPDARFVDTDLLDVDGMNRLMLESRPDAVVHLAAEALIDESIRDPGRFYRANTTGGMNLLEAMARAGVDRIVFSSTAAVYGQPECIPIVEDAPKAPVNSYGESKLAFERMMVWYRRAYGLKHISFRYFNACGATERVGEFHEPETHLIPIVFEAALGERESMRLFGSDYATPDGTCVRDYVHVVDIACAHILALEKLDEIQTGAYNLGNGEGYTNRQVIDTVERVTGRTVKVVPADRRPGDPAILIASSERARTELGWKPAFPDLTTMVQTAWDWRTAHPHGYAS